MWQILEIEPTNDIKIIRRAYAKKLRQINPATEPEKFQELKTAFDNAVTWAKSDATQFDESVLKDEKSQAISNASTDLTELDEDVNDAVDWTLPSNHGIDPKEKQTTDWQLEPSEAEPITLNEDGVGWSLPVDDGDELDQTFKPEVAGGSHERPKTVLRKDRSFHLHPELYFGQWKFWLSYASVAVLAISFAHNRWSFLLTAWVGYALIAFYLLAVSWIIPAHNLRRYPVGMFFFQVFKHMGIFIGMASSFGLWSIMRSVNPWLNIGLMFVLMYLIFMTGNLYFRTWTSVMDIVYIMMLVGMSLGHALDFTGPLLFIGMRYVYNLILYTVSRIKNRTS